MMQRGENSVTLPIDLILEILSRSSAKSIARFRLASKFSASLFSRPEFTELLLTKSSARPRLLFALERASEEDWCFYSSPELHNSYERSSSSRVVAADSYMKSPGNMSSEICGPVSGLIYFPNMRISKRSSMIAVPVIYNPSTGQYTSLPKPTMMWTRDLKSFLGFDPIDKQFKVLFISPPSCGEEEYLILTLRAGKVSWRKIEFPVHHDPLSKGICINGVLYYFARVYGYSPEPRVSIAWFDVRSETFSFLERVYMDDVSLSSSSTTLINYMGKLGVVSLQRSFGGHGIGLRLWVLKEHGEKQEWWKQAFWTNPVTEGGVSVPVVVAGVTATGEIVLSMDSISKPFYVFYFNPRSFTLVRVETRGFEAFENCSRVHTFVDHVEDLKFIT